MLTRNEILSLCLLLIGAAGISSHALTPPMRTSLPDGDKLIYGRLIESFRKQNIADVVAQKSLLEKNYPNSVHMDNALYLSGALQVQNNRIPEGLKDLSKLEKNYPNSLKRPSALFAKALAYKKLNLPNQEQAVLQSLVKKYVGSVESQKAWVELRLINERKTKAIKR